MTHSAWALWVNDTKPLTLQFKEGLLVTRATTGSAPYIKWDILFHSVIAFNPLCPKFKIHAVLLVSKLKRQRMWGIRIRSTHLHYSLRETAKMKMALHAAATHEDWVDVHPVPLSDSAWAGLMKMVKTVSARNKTVHELGTFLHVAGAMHGWTKEVGRSSATAACPVKEASV